jgi:hypothetical protein
MALSFEINSLISRSRQSLYGLSISSFCRSLHPVFEINGQGQGLLPALNPVAEISGDKDKGTEEKERNGNGAGTDEIDESITKNACKSMFKII